MPRNTEFLAGLNFVTKKAESGSNLHGVRAFTPDQDPSDPYERGVGSLSWSRRSGEIMSIGVESSYRRQGLATELLRRGRDFAQETRGVKAPKHSRERTNDGESWARSLGERLPRRDPL